MKVVKVSAVAALALVAATGCSQAGGAPERQADAPQVAPGSAKVAPAKADAATAEPAEGISRVLGKKDMTLRGAPACEVEFVYAGREPEDLFWEEPCPAVTAQMMTQRELGALNRWERIDSFGQKFVQALPGGKVLYVGGSFTASVYPVGTTGSTYEIAVAD